MGIAASVQPGFAQTKQVFYVNGRPVVVYRLRHEMAKEQEDVPYLSSILSPCPVMALTGRSASLAPQVDRREAVFSAWVDVITPLASSPQTPPDTLFLVFESDFCMAQAHALLCEKYLATEREQPWGGPTVRPTGAERSAASSSGPQGPDTAAAKGAGRVWQPEDLTMWWTKSHPTTVSGAYQNANRMLQSLVGMVTAAGRLKHGGLVWISWCAKEDQNQPNNGTTLIAITKKAAILLHNEMVKSVQPGHFDIYLKHMLRNPQTPDQQKLADMSCYVWAGVGGYRTHLSGCARNLVRECTWDKQQPWPETDVYGKRLPARWFVRFGNGPPKSRKLGDVPHNLWLLEWKTYLPPEFLLPNGQPDQEWLDRELGPPAGFEEPKPVAGASVQPASSAASPAAEATPPAAAASGQAGEARPPSPAPTAATSRPDDQPMELADWDQDNYSVYSVDDPIPEPMPEQAEPTADVTEPKRQRRAAPTDQRHIDEAVEKTEHRLRQRRKAMRGYFQYRKFTKDEAAPFTHVYTLGAAHRTKILRAVTT